MRWGKQAYEVFEGWLTDPIDTVLGKSSIGIKILMEQTLGIVKPGWQVPWADHDFLESLVAVDGNVWDGRLAAVAQKFLPMSMSSLFEYASGKDPSLIKPPSFVVPTKFGTSESKARREIASIARIYAEANWSSKFKGVYPEKTLRANVNEVLDAAKKNGYNIKSIYDGGISQARTYYYSQFMKALEANDFDKMVESAEKLHTLNTSYKGLKASIKGKFKKEEGIYDIPNNKAARMYTAWSVADKNQRKKGKINPYSFN